MLMCDLLHDNYHSAG